MSEAQTAANVGSGFDAAPGANEDVEAQTDDGYRARTPARAASPVSYAGLFRYASHRDKINTVVGVIAAGIGGTLMPVFTIFLGELVNALGDPTKDLMAELRRNILKIVYLSIGALAMGYLEVICFTISGRQQAYRVRGAYLESILKQDMAWHDTDGSVGKVIQGLNDQTEAYETAISTRLGMFVRNIATAAAALIVSFIRGWQLAFVITATMPALMVVSMGVSVFMKRLQAQVMASNISANGLVQQAVSSIRTVAAYGMEPMLVSKYDNDLAVPELAGIRQAYLSGFVIGSTNGVFFCSIALGTWYGSQRVADGSYNGGQVLSILLAGMLGGWSLGQAVPHLKHFQYGQAAAAHLFAVIARKPAIDVDGQGEVLSEVRGDLELENVSFFYPTRPDRVIFDGFSLTIQAGTTVALVGESGSGKSTIIQLIERFYDPVEGQVLLDGHNIKTLQVAWLRSQIALVSQEPTLFNTTIFENIANSRPDATEEEVIAAATAANAHGFIIKLPNGYNTNVGDKGGQLSGGQRQRIAIARALLRNPKVLLLDEATSALDAQSERAVQDALSKLMSDRTTVVVAHRLSTIMAADDIAVVCGGKVVEQGTHNDLMHVSGGIYAGMISRQQLVPMEESSLDNQEGGLRQKYGCATVKNKPVLRQSVLRRASVRLSVIPQDIMKKLTAKHTAKSSGDNEGYSRCYPLIRLDWQHVVGGIVSSIVLGAQMPGFALALSGITHVYYDPDPEEVKSGGSKWGLIFVGIAAATVLLSTLQGWCFGMVGQRFARRLRVQYFRAVLRQEMAWFDNATNNVGEIMSRLSNDISSIQGAIGDAFAACLQNVSMVLIGLAIAFSASWSLTLVTLGALPFMVFAQMMQSSQSFGTAQKSHTETAQATEIALEAISAIRVVSAYSLQAKTSLSYEKLALKSSSKSAHLSGLSFGLSQHILFLYYCLAFWFGGIQVDEEHITFENMVKAFNVIFFVAMGMGTASAQLPELGKVGPAIRRVFALIDSRPSIDIHKAGAEPLIDGDVELKSVTFAYPTRPGRLIFKEFNIKVQAGTSCALVGESGHGKSTIIGLLERFYDPVDGQVLIDGLDLQSISIKYLRSQIGLVGQEPVMFSTSILENIKIGNTNATMSQVVEAARVSNALSFIEKLPEAYDTRLGEGGVQLSGGQKQRIAIARAVLRNPRILMLDEATAALDAESERLVQDALNSVMAGRTTFIVAHRLSTIVDCEKIAAIYRGRVLEEGNHKHLMQLNGYYAYLVAASST